MNKRLLIVVIIATFLLGGLVGGRILPASSEVAPTEPVQGKGQIITFVKDAVVPAGSSAATNFRSNAIRLATYKKLSFLAGFSTVEGEILPTEILERIGLGLVFFEGGEHENRRGESYLSLPLGFWGVDLDHPSAQIEVPAPYGRVEISNTSDQDVVITVKAYATE